MLSDVVLLKNKNTDMINTDNLNLVLDKYYENISVDNRDKTILDILKYKHVGGVRIEASGRLTKRITAARAIFKCKYVGTLKNIDSSYKGLSSVILKGNQKSNVQFSKLNYVTRIGAFGLKGWVSGY